MKKNYIEPCNLDEQVARTSIEGYYKKAVNALFFSSEICTDILFLMYVLLSDENIFGTFMTGRRIVLCNVRDYA